MLQQIRNEWTDLIQDELKAFAAEKGVEIPLPVQVGKPPKAEQGDFAYPMFTFARAFGMNPAQIAGEIKKRLEGRKSLPAGEVLTLGPYLNIRVDSSVLSSLLHDRILAEGDCYGRSDDMKGRRIMIDFTSVI